MSKVVLDPIDQLDIVLNLLNHNNDEPEGFDELREKLKLSDFQISDKDLQIVVDKLCDDKYLAWVSGQTRFGTTSDKFFYITHLGRIFFQKSPSFILKKHPYKKREMIESIQTIYTISKTVATISYSLIIVFIAYWGVKLTDKTNRLEDELKKSEQVHRKQIDSLTRMLNDTTRLKN